MASTMSKSRRQMLRALACTPLIAGFGIATAVAQEGKATVITFAHQWPAPINGKGNVYSVLAERFAATVGELSKGSIKVEVYPANTLLQPKEQWSALQRGSLGAAVTVLGYFTGRVPELGLNVIGLFQDSETAQEYMDTRHGDALRALLDEQGMHWLMGVYEAETLGFRSKKVTQVSQF